MTMEKGHPAAALVWGKPSGMLLAALARRIGADRVTNDTPWRA